VNTTKGLAFVVSVALAGVLAQAANSAPPAGTSVVRLKAISSRVTGKGASLIIEATDPTAYVATRPDPLTLYVDFRNVDAEGLVNRFEASPKSPIARVAVEAVESMGAPASRVKITLAQAVAHHLRSDRNTTVIDFDPASVSSTAVFAQAARRGPDAMAALESAPVNAAVPASVINGPELARIGIAQRPTAAVSIPNAGALRQSPAAAQAVPGQAAAPPAQAAAPQAQAPGAAEPAGQARNERRFTGNPVSLDFQGADLRAVLRTFSEISGLNVVIDPKVTGTVDVALRDVPWDQALDIILRANSLGYTVEGTIVRIAPLDALEAEEKKRTDLAKAQVEAAQISTLTRQLSYAKGDDVAALLKASVLSNRGQSIVDVRTNTIIITDLADRLQSAADLINTIDKAQPQVEIEARIVQTSKQFARQLGVQWGFAGRVDPSLGNTTNLAFPNNGSLTGRTGTVQGPSGTLSGSSASVPTGVNLPVQGATSAIGLALGSINGAFNLDLALSAAERTGNIRLLSTPRVSTQNNVEAEIAQGVQIPYQTTANNTVTVQFKDAALTLKVTPQITASGTIIMKIAVDNGSVGQVFLGIPSINTQRANTVVQVNDGQTTVIGGIYSSSEQFTNTKTPGLSRVPLLGWLFKNEDLNNENKELLIFITFRIIKT
jgi:type IV pilus assembly protein PilQ